MSNDPVDDECGHGNREGDCDLCEAAHETWLDKEEDDFDE